MLKRCVFAGAVVLASAGIAVNAQTPAPSPQNPNEPRTAPTQPQAMDQRATTTLTGCVYRERDIPGRSPNVAERAGVLEDYILAGVQKGATTGQDEAATGQTAQPGQTTQPGQTGQPTATPGTTGTSGTPGTTGTSGMKHAMFKLEHADDDRLRALVGKRVEVTGRIDAEAGDTRRAPGATGTTGGTQQEPAGDRSIGPDRIELAEFEVTSIREASGDCPAKPDVSRR